MTTFRAAVALSLAGALCFARDAGAQSVSSDDGARYDVWAGVSVAPSGPSSRLVTSYSPPLLFDGEFTSHAGQTLTVEPGASAGFTAGANLFFTPRAGLQFVVDRRSSDAGGANAPYDFTLSYISRPPPDNLPQAVTATGSIPWPETTGSLTQWAVAVNAVARVGRSDRVHATVSAGPVLSRLTGVVQPVAFSAFHLGGHSVLFGDQFRLSMLADPKYAVGFDAGGDVNFVVGRHAAVVVGYRLFAGPAADVVFRPSRILNPDEAGVEQTIQEIAARLSDAPMRVSMTTSRFVVGFKIIG